LSNTRGCHSCASKKRGGIRGSKHWLRINHSLPLLLLARFARDNGNPTSRIVKSSDWPSGVIKSFLNAIEMALHRWRKNLGNAFRSLNVIFLGMALHRWRRRRLGTQPAKNSTFIYASLRLGLRARQLAGSGSSLGTKEASVAKDMAEVAILRQSLVYNFLLQSGPFRQRNLHFFINMTPCNHLLLLRDRHPLLCCRAFTCLINDLYDAIMSHELIAQQPTTNSSFFL
jgi:hypothetical protein